MAFGVLLVALLATLFSTGRRLAVPSAAAATAYYGLASMIHPDYPASVGKAWGSLAIAWAALLALAATRSARDIRVPRPY